MKTKATTLWAEGRSKRRTTVLAGLAIGAALVVLVSLAVTAQQAGAASADWIVFTSNRAAGAGVDNTTRDYEIFRMNPDGTGLEQLTINKRNDFEPVLSPDGARVAYTSHGVQASNPEGDTDVYVMNAVDGSGKKNLSNNGAGVEDRGPYFSPGGKRIAYESYGKQPSNPEGDYEVYVVNAVDGSGKKNLTNNGVEVSGERPVEDFLPDFSPDGKKIAYASYGKQSSNPEGEYEVYSMNALDGTDKRNLTNNGVDVDDHTPNFSPDGATISYTSYGEQTSNSDGDYEVYRLNAGDGSGQVNLSDSGANVDELRADFSPDGASVVYESEGVQRSNPEGDREIYRANALDGKGKRNLTDNKAAYDGYFLPGQN